MNQISTSHVDKLVPRIVANPDTYHQISESQALHYNGDSWLQSNYPVVLLEKKHGGVELL